MRVLETRRFCRIGSNEEVNFTGRIVAATHADMRQLVKGRLFREDLFYRLSVFELEIPSLEQRRGDIPLLVNHFAKQMGIGEFSQSALEILKYSRWPGNIRQLRNTIDKISVLSEGDNLSAQSVQDLGMCEEDDNLISKLAQEIIAMPIENKLKAIENALVEQAVTMSNGNKTQAARLLGVHRKVVERRLFQTGE